MEHNWKKRYSFRLTEKDKAIYEFLNQIPDNKRSEAIRQLLGIAVQYINVEQKEQNMFQKLLKEMEAIKHNQTSQYEKLFHVLEQGNGNKLQRTEKDNTADMSDQAVTDTANAFLSSFGMDG